MDIKNDTLYENLLSTYSEKNTSYVLDNKICERSLMKIIFSNFVTDKVYQNNQKRFAEYILSKYTANHIDKFSYVGEFYEKGFKRVRKTDDLYERGLVCKKMNSSGNTVSTDLVTRIDDFNAENMHVEFNGYFYTASLFGEFTFYATTDSNLSLVVDNKMIIDITDSYSQSQTIGRVTLAKDTYYPISVKMHNGFGSSSLSLAFSHAYIKRSNDGTDVFYHMPNKQHDIKTSIPTVNTNIIDFDISQYASESVKAYLFFLDFIMDMYRSVQEIKGKKESHILDTMHIRSRYYYKDGGIRLYIDDDFYNINLKISRQGIENRVSDISITSEMPVSNVFSLFKKDVIRHLNYLNGDDVKFADQNYINEMQNFYMTCRLKLMYSISHSVLLMSSVRNPGVYNAVDNRIRMVITPIFMNFKEHVLSFVDASSKGLVYSNEVLSAKYDIGQSNELISSSKDVMIKHKNSSKFSEGNLRYKKTINAVAILTLVSVLICIMVVIAMDAHKDFKSVIALVVTVIVVIVMLVIRFLKQKREGFTNPNMKTVTLTSGEFHMFGSNNYRDNLWQGHAIPNLKLPDDYYDDALISWDITIKAHATETRGRWWNVYYLNIGHFRLPEGGVNAGWHTRTHTNRTTPLIINDSRFVTGSGGSYSKSRWRHCTYTLTIRYDLDKAAKVAEARNRMREDQLASLIQMGDLSRQVAEILLQEKEAEKELLKFQNVIKNTEIEIEVLTNQYNEEKNRLSGIIATEQAILDNEYLLFKKELAEKTVELQRKEAEAKKLVLDVAKSQADAQRELNRIDTETNLKNESITNTQRELDVLRNRALQEFGTYISASDRAQLAEISYLNAENAYKIIKIALDKDNKSVTDDLAATQAKYIMDSARLDRDKRLVEEETAKINSERTSIELENKRKQLIAEQLQMANNSLNNSIDTEKTQYDIASVAEEIARQKKIMAENNAALNLNNIGQRYDGSDIYAEGGPIATSIINLNSLLETKIAHEQEQRAILEREAARERLTELGNISVEASANAIIAVNDKLIEETDTSIKYYNGALDASNKRLVDVQNARRGLEMDLANAIASAASSKDTAENKYREMELRTRLEINTLLQERFSLRNELIRQILLREHHARESLQEKILKESLLSKLDNMVKDLSATKTEADYYDDLTKNIEIFDLLKDVDASIIYNVNTSINTTNHEMVIPRLLKEKKHFKEYSEATERSALLSGTDINVKEVDRKEIHAVNDFLLNMTLVLAFSMTMYYYMSPKFSALIFLIGATVSTVWFIVESSRIVRTKAKNHYWSQPRS